MKQLTLVILFVTVQFVSYSQTISYKLNEYFIAAQKADIFNGSVLIMEKGKVLLNKGYGFKNFEAKSLNDEQTIFQIGSITKQFTATLILKLAEQNKLSLSDKLVKYYPNFPNADKITIENLLTHTSGIWNYTNDKKFMETWVEKSIDEAGMVSLFKNKPLDFEPGTQYSYSNSGYILLGFIIQKVSGKKYGQMLRTQIFQPLQMYHSGLDFTHLISSNKATGYQSITTNNSAKSMIVDSSVSFSAGAIYSTTGDLYKWNHSLSTDRILNKKSLQNAFTPRLEKYGLGWITDTINGHPFISHDGGIHGFLAHNIVFPADSIFITILSNSNSSKVEQVGKDVEAILFNKPYNLPLAYKEIAIDTSILVKYVGAYELAPTFKIDISLVNGSLKAQATGQPQFDLFAKSETMFFLKVVDAQIEFIKNDQGETDQLILHQNGAHQPAKKVK